MIEPYKSKINKKGLQFPTPTHMKLNETQQKIAKAKVNPIFEGLSDDLKDPKQFKSIEKKIANIMLSDHKHRKVAVFMNCKRCQVKLEKKRALIRDLGFRDVQQYQGWKKIMGIITNKESLQLYAKN
jgi:hypothetical protein